MVEKVPVPHDFYMEKSLQVDEPYDDYFEEDLHNHLTGPDTGDIESLGHFGPGQALISRETRKLSPTSSASSLGCGSHSPATSIKAMGATDAQFQFCIIEKVASTSFREMLSGLNKWMPPRGSFKGVFLRDPKDRFLSAWVSKCHHRADGLVENDGSQCLGRAFVPPGVPVGSNASVVAFEHFVTAVMKPLSARVLRDGKDGKIRNRHFRPQRCFCGGLYADLHDYHYVGHLQGNRRNVNQQVREMLIKAGVMAANASQVADETFPASDDDDPHNSHASATDIFKAYYRNPEIHKIVETLYALDYQLPNMHSR